MASTDKPLVWLHGEVKSPPLSAEGRIEVGCLLRSLQRGERIGMPESRPMPSIGVQCHELRIRDLGRAWRIVYRIDEDAIVILDVFEKKSQKTPKRVIDNCRRRIRQFDSM
jgi:phage-related protein